MSKIFLFSLFVGTFILLYILVSTFKQKKSNSANSSPNKEALMEISLKDLSWIWVPQEEKTAASFGGEKSNLAFSTASEDNKQFPTTSSKTETALVTSVSALTQGFYSDVIEPYIQEIKEQNALELINELIDFIEKYGGCPSVVFSKMDKESINFAVSLKDTITKVTLREHTYQVVSFMIKFVKDVFVDWESQIPRVIVTGLAHDLGKVPELHIGHYSTHEHPLISEQKLMEIVNLLASQGKAVPVWLDSVREAIREHHLPKAKGQLTSLLKKADRESRAVELARHMSDYKILPFNEWFKVDELIRKLELQINVTQTSKWCGISYNNTIYVRPECIFSLVNSMREEKKVLDSLFLYLDNTDLILQQVVSELKKAGVTSPILKEGHYAIKCKVSTSTSRVTGKHQQMLLTPLRLDVVSSIVGVSINTIESRKAGILQVLDIEPVL